MRINLWACAVALACAFACLQQAAAQTTTRTAPDFDYTGNKGPGFWDKIDKNCAATPEARQSPINIEAPTVDRELAPLRPALAASNFEMWNTGYTIQADISKANGNVLILNGKAYELVQFHFHTLSEHLVNWGRADLELHAVFKASDTDLAVIGVLYRVGSESAALQQVINAGLPEQTTSERSALTGWDLKTALGDTSSYYTYPGSLTTPPCSPVVTWFVLKNQLQLSPKQFQAFRKILGNDFRPVQDLNGRTVEATAK